jgi:CHAT domain-containing protein
LGEAREWYEQAVDLLDTEQEARRQAGLFEEPEWDRLFSPIDPRAGWLDHLVRVCNDLGDIDAARRYAARSQELNSTRPTDEGRIEGLIETGDAAAEHGDFDFALGCFHQAFYDAEEMPGVAVPRALVRALNALGRCHHQLGLYRSALAYFERARQLNQQYGNAVRLTWDYREIGRVYRARPDLGEAREALEASLLNASRRDDAGQFSWRASDGLTYQITAADRAWETLLELGSLLEDRGDFAAAASFLELATQVAAVVRASAVDDTQRAAIANQRIDAFAALTRLSLRRALAGAADATSAAEDAWRANESMRARSFLDAIGDDELGIPIDIPHALAEHEAAALKRRHLLTTSAGHGSAFWADLGQVQKELEEIWDRMVAVTPTAQQYVEVRRSRPASAADIHNLIAADNRPTVIASVTPLGADQLAVIAVRSDEPEPMTVSQPADLRRLARFITENLGTSGRARELATDLEDLFRHEMEPLTKALAEVSERGDILVACPFGALNYVPLAALWVDDVPLVERNPLAVLPSASLARALRAAAGTPPQVPAMVFGDPTGDLPGARNEASLVAAMLGAKPIMGPDVTQAAVSVALRSAGTVHVASHAYFDAEDPLSSGMRLSDGVLSARHLIAMSAPALSLVTLSACETGVNQENPAQELLGLTRALLFAGADSLLVSLWKVPDLATADIMSHFYSELRKDTGKADALQAAMLAARERYGRQRFDLWAGFELIGEWR